MLIESKRKWEMESGKEEDLRRKTGKGNLKSDTEEVQRRRRRRKH